MIPKPSENLSVIKLVIIELISVSSIRPVQSYVLEMLNEVPASYAFLFLFFIVRVILWF